MNINSIKLKKEIIQNFLNTQLKNIKTLPFLTILLEYSTYSKFATSESFLNVKQHKSNPNNKKLQKIKQIYLISLFMVIVTYFKPCHHF